MLPVGAIINSFEIFDIKAHAHTNLWDYIPFNLAVFMVKVFKIISIQKILYWLQRSVFSAFAFEAKMIIQHQSKYLH